MKHKEAEEKDKNGVVVKCMQRLKELRYHGIFKGFYCRKCDEYLIKRH